MSTGEDDRRTLIRRASLHLALWRGDLLGATRAWDRLRVDGATVTLDEAERARAARLAIGHAIRDARWRRGHDDKFGIPLAPPTALPRPRGIGASMGPLARPLLAVALLATVALVIVFLPGAVPAGPSAFAPRATSAPGELTGSGRGRTSATIAPLAPVVAQPTAGAPTAPPSPGASGGVGILPVGAVVKLLPPPQQTGWDRFVFRVIDANTQQPVPGVCVIYGTSDCGPNRPHTNDLGLWWIDFPRSESLAPLWDFGFSMDGYSAQKVQVEYVPGASSFPHEVRIQRRPS